LWASPPAGANDIIARVMGQWLGDRLGRHSSSETGRGRTHIAAEAAINAAPDGYTLLITTVSNAISATLYEKLSFNFIRDIAPVASLARGDLCDGGKSFGSGQDRVAEFIAYAKDNTGKNRHGLRRHWKRSARRRRIVSKQ